MKGRIFALILFTLQETCLATMSGDHGGLTPPAGVLPGNQAGTLRQLQILKERNPEFDVMKHCRPVGQPLVDEHGHAVEPKFHFSLRNNVGNLLTSWIADELHRLPPRLRGSIGYPVDDLNRLFNDPDRFLAWASGQRAEHSRRLHGQIARKQAELAEFLQHNPVEQNEIPKSKFSAIYQTLVGELGGPIGEQLRARAAVEREEGSLRAAIKELTLTQPANAGAILDEYEERLRQVQARIEELSEPLGIFATPDFLSNLDPNQPSFQGQFGNIPGFSGPLEQWATRHQASLQNFLRVERATETANEMRLQINTWQNELAAIASPATMSNIIVTENLLRHRADFPYAYVVSLQNAGKGPSLHGISAVPVTFCSGQFFSGWKASRSLVHIDGNSCDTEERGQSQRAANELFWNHPRSHFETDFACSERPTTQEATLKLK